MSDFLNFNVQDEILNGDPEFEITQKPNGKYDIEMTTEVIQEATDLNKATLDRLKIINQIMGYEKVNDNDDLNFVSDILNTNNIVDGIRDLIIPNSTLTDTINSTIVGETSTSYRIIRPSININANYYGISEVSGSNGYSYLLYIVDKTTESTLKSLNLGNATNTGVKVINENLMAVTSANNFKFYETETFNYKYGYTFSNDTAGWGKEIIKIKDNKILCIAVSGSNKITIHKFNEDGSSNTDNVDLTITNETSSSYLNPHAILNSNGDIIVFLKHDSLKKWGFVVLNETGLTLKQDFKVLDINAYNYNLTSIFPTIDFDFLQDGKIVVFGGNGNTSSNVNMQYSIIDTNYNIFKEYETDIQIKYVDCIKQINNFIYVFTNNKLIKYDLSNDTYISTTKYLGDASLTYGWNDTTKSELIYSEKLNGIIMYSNTCGSSNYTAYLNIIVADIDTLQTKTTENIVLHNNSSSIAGIPTNQCSFVFDSDTNKIYGCGGAYHNNNLYISNVNISLKTKQLYSNCKLNGINIDTMLGNDKFYELVYNEDQNKFIAEEVRN